MTRTEDLEVNISANADELENAIDDVKEAVDRIGIPNITIRNRGDVYFTINFFREEDEKND